MIEQCRARSSLSPASGGTPKGNRFHFVRQRSPGFLGRILLMAVVAVAATSAAAVAAPQALASACTPNYTGEVWQSRNGS